VGSEPASGANDRETEDIGSETVDGSNYREQERST
jgi:hypothetical protein